MKFKSIVLLISAIQQIHVLSAPVPAKPSSSVKIKVSGKNNGGITLVNNGDGSQSLVTPPPTGGNNKVNIKVTGKGNGGITVVNNGGGSQSTGSTNPPPGPVDGSAEMMYTILKSHLINWLNEQLPLGAS